MVDTVLWEKVGLKVALYRAPLASDPRAVYKLAAAVLGHHSSLRAALTSAHIRTDAGSDGMALVMTYDLLLGHGLRGGGRLKRELVAQRPQLEEALAAAPNGRAHGSALSSLPRYLRVNRMRLPSDAEASAARARLRRDLLRRAREEAQPLEDADELANIAVDELVPNLLVAHARARPWLQGLPAIERGDLVLQDRSSCLAALAAGLSPGDAVLDACAAPGSKTAHVVELLGGRGRVVAFERNPRRAVILVSRLRQLAALRREHIPNRAVGPGTVAERAGHSVIADCTSAISDVDEAWFANVDESTLNSDSVERFRAASGVDVEVHVRDFLECDPEQPPFCDIRVLIVDPSCSGSGLPEHHLGNEGDMSVSKPRLRKLAAFQCRILAHALRFPSARTVIYSTCSTQREENEDVVAEVLRRSGPHLPFKVVEALPWWGRGEAPSGHPAWAAHCVRCHPAEHQCRGFFLCRLDRSEERTPPDLQDCCAKRTSAQLQPDCGASGVPCAVKRRRCTDAVPVEPTMSSPIVVVKRRRRQKKNICEAIGAAATPLQLQARPYGAKRKVKHRGLRIVACPTVRT